MFKYSILGGTFDYFHKGHKKLIHTAFEQSQRVTIGLATEKLYAHKVLRQVIQPYEVREQQLFAYLHEKGYDKRATIAPLFDIFGPALTDEHIDAVFVTQETIKGAEEINRKRQQMGFTPLEIVIVPFIHGSDGEVITSERIRLGEIDRNGNAYADIFKDRQVLHLPDNLREDLKVPAGKVVTDLGLLNKVIRHPEQREGSSQKDSSPEAQNDGIVISVGDIVTRDLVQNGINPMISIIDLKTRRREISGDEVLTQLKKNAVPFNNRQATINPKIATVLHTALQQYLDSKSSTVILVDGEEDLLALPAILLAPLASIVVYGLYDVGAVVVKVTEEKKKYVLELLQQFE